MPNTFGYVTREDIPTHQYGTQYPVGSLVEDHGDIFIARRYVNDWERLDDVELAEILRPAAGGRVVADNAATEIWTRQGRYADGDIVSYNGSRWRMQSGAYDGHNCISGPPGEGATHWFEVIEPALPSDPANAPEWDRHSDYASDDYVTYNGTLWRMQNVGVRRHNCTEPPGTGSHWLSQAVPNTVDPNRQTVNVVPWRNGGRYRGGTYVDYIDNVYVNTCTRRTPCSANPTNTRHWRLVPSEWDANRSYGFYNRVRYGGRNYRASRSFHTCEGHRPDISPNCWTMAGTDDTPNFVRTPVEPAVGAPMTGHFDGQDTYIVTHPDRTTVRLSVLDTENTTDWYNRVHAVNDIYGLYLNGNIPADYTYTEADRRARPVAAGNSSMDEPDPPADPQAIREPVFEPNREEHVIIPHGKKCFCEACKALAGEVNELYPGQFVSYSYEPARWTLNSVTNDPDNFHFGVELETDNTRHQIDNARAASMARPTENFWLAKTDASVSGPEFVSFPATLAWWREHYDDFEEMFKMLLHAGFRSHDGGHAGMHINLSRNSFGDQNHLYRFLTLLHHSPPWALTMSQRSAQQADHWAPLSYMQDRANRRRAAQTGRNVSSGRYVALNMENRNRLEFRLPRGTLRVDRFFKNLEWVHAMIKYTQEKPLIKCTPKEFMRWVSSSDYPYLAAFLGEKFDVAVR